MLCKPVINKLVNYISDGCTIFYTSRFKASVFFFVKVDVYTLTFSRRKRTIDNFVQISMFPKVIFLLLVWFFKCHNITPKIITLVMQ